MEFILILSGDQAEAYISKCLLMIHNTHRPITTASLFSQNDLSLIQTLSLGKGETIVQLKH